MRSSTAFYLSRLDHLRFCAAALVVLFHHFHLFVPYIAFGNPLASLVNEGHVGIGLFMVLSGFIFSVLTAGQSIQYGQFLFNRFVRIYPLYVFAVVFAVTLMVYQKQQPLGASAVLEWLLLFRPPTISEFWQFQHLWTIPVEFSFYVLFPFLHRFYQQQGARYFLGLLALLLLMRTGVFLEFGSVRFLAYETLFGRLDQFLLGYLAGVCYVGRKGERVFGNPLVLVAAAVIVIALVHLLNQLGGTGNMQAWWWTIWPLVEGMAWALLVLAYVFQRWALPGWADRLLAQGGVLSFSLYVCHPFVLSVISPRIGVFAITGSEPANVVITGLLTALPVSLAVSVLLHRVIEKPFLAFRRPYVHKPEVQP